MTSMSVDFDLRTEQQNGKRDQRDGRNWAQELDRRVGERPQRMRTADRDADHDACDQRYNKPDRPGLQGCTERRPKGGGHHFLKQRHHDVAERRQIMGGDDPNPRHDLKQQRETDQAAETLQPNERAGPDLGPHVGPMWSHRAPSSAASVPIPKFASLCGNPVCELWNRRTLATDRSSVALVQKSA